MATLNTTDDLLRAARENREFREAFRREILTEDLIDSPRELRELKAITGSLAEGIAALVQGMADYRSATDTKLERIENSVFRVEDMVREQEQAQSSFRGVYAERVAGMDDLEIAGKFAELHGLDEDMLDTTHISRNALRDWVRDHRDELLSLDLRQEGALGKFRRPDVVALVSEMRSDPMEPVFYLAVEASYSGEEKDIDKATDNAKILRAVTGLEAYPVVAAVRLHRRMSNEARARLYEDVNEYLAAGDADTAFWYRLDSADLRPPEPR